MCWCSPDNNDLLNACVHVVHLSDEDGCDRLVQSCTIHVYCGSYGQHEAGNPPVDAQLGLQTVESDGQSGRAANKQSEM